MRTGPMEMNGERKETRKGSINTFVPLIDQMKAQIASKDPWFSLEFFPPKTIEGANDLFQRMKVLAQGQPLFCDVTWHPSNHPGDVEKPTSSMCVASTMLNYLNINTMIHMTCTHQPKMKIKEQLITAKKEGIRNILALRGDFLPGEDWDPKDNNLSYAKDFVKFIREEHDNHFVIAVAGYPVGHPECPSYRKDLRHLKEKVDAGADFVISQLFFDAKTFIDFVDDCRKIGITCPIIPGILPIQSYDSLRHISKLAKLEVPKNIGDTINPIKGNDEAIRKFGIFQAVEMCKVLLNSGKAPGLHFYTLNRDYATNCILKKLGLFAVDIQRPLPWKLSANYARIDEEIRPIFWNMRPQSYICRTSDWDKFPNGRWGNSSLASFGKLTDYYMFYLNQPRKAELLKMWGTHLEKEEDVWKVFQLYITGEENENGIKISMIPWNDDVLSTETSLITNELSYLNSQGVLTINSQPAINGLSSSDPVFGWGYPNGYVYQKAYLEFFVAKEKADILKDILPKYPQVNYHIVSSKGDINDSNCDETQPIAVTWGVFPGQEIIQPTVVDPVAFNIWKQEAFDLWKTNWGNLYQPDSESRKIINYFHEHYLLVNLVDNEFQKPTCLWDIMADMLSEEKRR